MLTREEILPVTAQAMPMDLMRRSSVAEDLSVCLQYFFLETPGNTYPVPNMPSLNASKETFILKTVR